MRNVQVLSFVVILTFPTPISPFQFLLDIGSSYNNSHKKTPPGGVRVGLFKCLYYLFCPTATPPSDGVK
jgi:hypothetical protein